MKAAIYSSVAVLVGVGAALCVYRAGRSERAGSRKIAPSSPIGAAVAVPPALPSFGAAPPVRGMAIGLYHDTPARPYETQLREIKSLGATHVALVVHWFQSHVRSLDLAPHHERTVHDTTLASALDAARSLGLRALVLPIVQLDKRAMGEWRGTISPPSWKAWWARYQDFVLRYAGLAARHGAAMFSVGSELVSTERQVHRWSSLIEAVRARFRGEVIYSANWDAYAAVPFWDLVDGIGVSAYFEIAKDGADPGAMSAAWKKARDALEMFARARTKPLILTEVGYPSVVGGARWPWHYGRSATVDVDEQARAYQAFIDAWQDRPALAGVFFWNWEGEGGPRDTGYTPRGKPAEHLVRAWFRAGSGAATR